eukprot:14121_1
MSSVLPILTIFIATVSSECNYAVIGTTKLALDICMPGGHGGSVKATCDNNDFTLYQYPNDICTETVNTTNITGPYSAAMFGINDYSCTGTTTDCDFSLALLYMAQNDTSCGQSSSSQMKITTPMWNNYCNNGTKFIVTNCYDSHFSVTRKEYNDSECTIGERIYNHTEGETFKINGTDFCVELSSENVCTVYTAPTLPECNWIQTNANTYNENLLGYLTTEECIVEAYSNGCDIANIGFTDGASPLSHDQTEDGGCFCQYGDDTTQDGSGWYSCFFHNTSLPESTEIPITESPEASECNWIQTNANLVGEYSLGYLSTEECVEEAYSNGCDIANIGFNDRIGPLSHDQNEDGSCWCQYGDDTTQDSLGWYSCFFDNITPAIESPESLESPECNWIQSNVNLAGERNLGYLTTEECVEEAYLNGCDIANIGFTNGIGPEAQSN